MSVCFGGVGGGLCVVRTVLASVFGFWCRGFGFVLMLGDGGLVWIGQVECFKSFGCLHFAFLCFIWCLVVMMLAFVLELRGLVRFPIITVVDEYALSSWEYIELIDFKIRVVFVYSLLFGRVVWKGFRHLFLVLCWCYFCLW